MINEYNIVKCVVMSEKSGQVFTKEGKVTLEVARDANKVSVRHAVEKIWDVKVDSVNIVNVSGKRKRFARRLFTTSAKKKAIIKLKKGYKIDFPGQFEAGADVTGEGN